MAEEKEKPDKPKGPKEGQQKPPKEPKAEKSKGEKSDKGEKKEDKPKAPKAPPVKPPPARLRERYHKEILPALAKKLGRTNINSLPKLEKIVVNMGVGKALLDKAKMEQSASMLTQITGQKALITKAKVAVSGFRLRENNEIGCKVTLRGQRMFEFLDRLISIALPRIRDFRGVNPKSFDGNGNYNLGLAEQVVFPEIDPDKVTFTQGMDIAFVTSTHKDEEARELLRGFGMPFRES
jgi:large subunit ribosomal protein L5